MWGNIERFLQSAAVLEHLPSSTLKPGKTLSDIIVLRQQMPWAEMDAFKNVAVYVSHCQVSWNTQAILPRQIATWLWPLELRGPQSWIVTVMILPFSSWFWVLINIRSSFSWTRHSSTCLKHTANVLSFLACRFACYLVPPLLSTLTAAALRRQEG